MSKQSLRPLSKGPPASRKNKSLFSLVGLGDDPPAQPSKARSMIGLDGGGGGRSSKPGNMATRLFANIRLRIRKLRRKRGDVVVDLSPCSFGSYFDVSGSGREQVDRSPAFLQSSKSIDNVFESFLSYDSRRRPSQSQARFVREPEQVGRFDCTPETAVTAPVVMPSSPPSTSRRRRRRSGDVLDAPVPTPCEPRSLTKELESLLHYGWYWAGISKEEAERMLKDEPDGAFVVRDSSSDHYFLSLSFNCNGHVLHTRIQYVNDKFSFYSSDADSFSTVAELIEHCIAESQVGVFCYYRGRRQEDPSYPVKLTKPISRFTEVKSLLYLSRFVIRKCVRVDLLPQLPLPKTLIDYVSEQRYI